VAGQHEVWAAVNQVLNILFGVLFWPIQWLTPLLQVVIVSIPAAVIVLSIYRMVSNQSAIRNSKDKIVAHLLEIRIFRDDLRVLLGSQLRVFLNIGRYLLHSFIPVAFMLLPFGLFMAQIESRFAFQGLENGKESLLSVQIGTERPVSSLTVNLIPQSGIDVVTPPFRLDATGEVLWRVKATETGRHLVVTQVGDRQTERFVIVGDVQGVMPMKYHANDVRSLLYPHEESLSPDSQIIAMKIDYPRARAVFMGLSSASWLFVGFVMLFAFALRSAFRVTF